MASVTGGALPGLEPDKDQVLAQVHRILESAAFRASDASRLLLTFLANWSLDRPGQHVKESEIAISVFHREPSAFDSQSDSVVRVQMARLRTKILEYYATAGAADEIVIEIPKGAYCIVASQRPPVEIPAEAEAPIAIPQLHAAAPARRQWIERIGFAFCGAAIALAAVVLFRPQDPGVAAPVRQFWSGVLAKGAPNAIVFSNPRLAGRLAFEGLHYFRDGVDSLDPANQNLSYAGAGDVRSVRMLTQLFDALRQPMRVRSGALLSWEQAKESNLIFIGRPEQNPALHKLPRLHDFYFKFATGIVNLHPQAGEKEIYACSDRPYTEDYAVVALIPGLDPPNRTLILAGNTTYGSEAATEFVTREASIQTLLAALGVKPGAKIPYFEALLQVRINNETPVWSRLVAARLHPAEAPAWEAALPDER